MIRFQRHIERFAFFALVAAVFCGGGCMAAAAVSSARATSYYVAPTGSDSNAGSPAAPFSTIAKGISALAPGDTLNILPGVYKESCTVTIKADKENPVLIRAAKGAWLQATGKDGILVWQSSYVTIEGLKVTGAARAGLLAGQSDHVTFRGCICGDNGVWGIQTSLCDHVTVENCELYGSKKEHGVYFSTTDHPTAIDNHIHDNRVCGIHMNADAAEGGDGIITRAYIARNKIQRCGAGGGAAINMDGVERSTVENNVLDYNLAGGITSFKGDAARAGSRNKFTRNVIRFEAGKGRYGIQLFHGSTRAVLDGNTIGIDNGPAIEIDEASLKGLKSAGNFYVTPEDKLTFSHKGKEMDLNAWRAATGQDADSKVIVMPPPKDEPAE